MILTNFVVTLMQTEGSTYYRSEAAAQPREAQAAETSAQGKKRKNDSLEEARPKAKAKGKKKGKQDEQTKDDDTEAATAGDADDDDAEDALPW